MLDLTVNTASTMSIVSLPAHSCSRLCTVRQLSRHQHCHNAVRLAFERQARPFCSDHSTPQARATVSAAGIGGNMLAGLKKAFSSDKRSCSGRCQTSKMYAFSVIGCTAFTALSSLCVIDSAIGSMQGPANSRSLKRTFGKANQPALKLYR